MTGDKVKSKQIHRIARAVFSSLAMMTGAASVVWAQATPLLQYDKSDRQQKLEEAAKAEGSLTVYTAFRPSDLPLILAPFEAKYGIKVKAWRSGSNNVTQRVIREGASKKAEVDLIMMPASEMAYVWSEKLLQPVTSPFHKDMMPGTTPQHLGWAVPFLNVTVHSYNTNLYKREDLPKTYQDLLHPKWKGNLGVEGKAEEWFTRVVSSMGEEQGLKLFKDIVARNGISVRQGASLLHNMVVAGEVPLALTTYIDLPAKDKRAGKPVDWFAMSPVVAQGFAVAVSQRAPNPHAALLFYDYMLSPDTQKLLASLHFLPANTRVPSPYPDLKVDVVDPVATLANFTKWNKLFEDTVTKAVR
jgi:iron(III) transport system substrate-binding protein